MKLSESPKTAKNILNLIREIRPDQAQNFAKADKWFDINLVKQYGNIEVDELMDIIERYLAFQDGPITIATIFNWVKEGLAKNVIRRMKDNKISQQDYYK